MVEANMFIEGIFFKPIAYEANKSAPRISPPLYDGKSLFFIFYYMRSTKLAFHFIRHIYACVCFVHMFTYLHTRTHVEQCGMKSRFDCCVYACHIRGTTKKKTFDTRGSILCARISKNARERSLALD